MNTARDKNGQPDPANNKHAFIRDDFPKGNQSERYFCTFFDVPWMDFIERVSEFHDQNDLSELDDLKTATSLGVWADVGAGDDDQYEILATSVNNGEMTMIEATEEAKLANLFRGYFNLPFTTDTGGTRKTGKLVDPAILESDLNKADKGKLTNGWTDDKIKQAKTVYKRLKSRTMLYTLTKKESDNANYNNKIYLAPEAPAWIEQAAQQWDPITFNDRHNASRQFAIMFDWPNIGADNSDDEENDNMSNPTPIGQEPIINRRYISKHANVLIQGVAGCGKSHLLESLQREYEGNVEVVVFHPSTTYEDFVRGLRPSESSFKVRDGIFLELCKKAANHPDTDYLLFIDEINRANTARVLGDLMLVLEKSKRRTFKEGVPALEVTRPVPAENESFASVKLQLAATEDDAAYGTQKGNQYLSVPSNLHVVGTMNTTDRSTGTIDLALQRRFKVVVQLPLSASALESALLEAIAEKSDEAAYLTNDEDASALHQEVIDLVGWWNSLNQKLEKQVGPDAMMGHSYFFSTIGDDYADNAEEEETAEDEDSRKRRAYLDNVTSMVLNQLAEVAQLFNMSKQTLSDVQRSDKSQSGVPGYEVKHKGEGLGSMPQVMRINRDEAEASTTAPADGSKDDSPEV